MRIWPERKSAVCPRTHVGRWLRATLLDQGGLADRLKLTLNGGKPGWNYDEPAVVEAVCSIAVRRVFSSSIDAPAITTFVSGLRSRIHSASPPGHAEIEAVVRFALGDQEVAFRHIKDEELLFIYGLVAIAARLRLGLDETAVDQLIVEGEQLAFGQGWHPPLAA